MWMLHYRAYWGCSRNVVHLVLLSSHTHPFLHLRGRGKLKYCSRTTHHLLHLDHSHVLLSLLDCLHRPRHHSEKAVPRTFS
jgi:hypothetical protein